MITCSIFNDQELTVLLKQGNHSAFEEVFKRYSKVLYSHVFNKLRDADDAHDVVQEVFARLWKSREQLKENNNLGGYLFINVRNLVFDRIRHKKVITSYEESFKVFDSKSYLITDHLIREKQFAELIEREIAALPPRMREVFELSRKEYLSNKDIALKMGITESTVADQMKKALRSLRLKLGLLLFFSIYINF